MDPGQSQNFNDRLSQWVGNQGFWFQARYSLAGGGMKGRALMHLLRLAFRLMIFLVIVAIGVWVYLLKRSDTARFRQSLQEDLRAGLTATTLEMRGCNRIQGQLEISRLVAEGGNETFFTNLEARSIHCKMGLLDGLLGIWKPGAISIARLDMDLRAGADDANSAAKLASALFRKPTMVDVPILEVAEATVRWGYSERTQGAIESSALNLQRTDHGWRLSFKGGWLSQNWLRKLEIVNLVVICNADGLVFEKAELKQGAGTVDFSGLRLTGGERPQVAGIAKIRNLSLEGNMPSALLSYVEGSISGDFRVFGSTNTSDGIGFEGQVILDGKDQITLRQQIHLLKALSVVDYSRKYHRIDFRDGNFQMKTTHGGIELTNVKLTAEELFTLEGKMTVRLPTQEEIKSAEVKAGELAASPLFSGQETTVAAREVIKPESGFSLKRAAQESRKIKEGTQNTQNLSLFDRLNEIIEERRIKSQAAERMARMLHYEGAFQITIPGDAFEQAPMLKERYPANPATGRISMLVPIDGNFYELTLKQAEEIYVQGQRKR